MAQLALFAVCGLVGSFCVCAAVSADDLMNKADFQTASEKSDFKFESSLIHTAALLDYCGKKEQAQELRDYIQGFSLVGARVQFENVKASRESLESMRGMYLSRIIATAFAIEAATQATLKKIELTAPQRKSLCDFADGGYDMFKQLRANAKKIAL